MPLYFFDVMQDGIFMKDDEGEILDDVNSVEDELVHMIAEVGWESAMSFAPFQLSIFARDEAGSRVASACLTLAIPAPDMDA